VNEKDHITEAISELALNYTQNMDRGPIQFWVNGYPTFVKHKVLP